MNYDFHSHIPGSDILSLTPDEYSQLPADYDGRITVGVHPWDTADDVGVERQFKILRQAVGDHRVVAVGECGLDTTRGASIERQAEILLRQAQIAHDSGLPMVLHIVRGYDRLLHLLKKFPSVPAIAIHSVAASPEMAIRLAERGIFLSAGPRTKVSTIEAIPNDNLLLETDAMKAETVDNENEASAVPSIVEQYERVDEKRKQAAEQNFLRFFSLDEKL